MESIEDIYEEIEDDELSKSYLTKYLKVFVENADYSMEQDDRRKFLYRGQSDCSFNMQPSVFRDGLLEKEHLLIKDMLLMSPNEFRGITDPLEKLMKMQHYGLPTRLLDITTNPLVALYFACVSNSDKDGEILVLYDYMEYPDSKKARIMSDISRFRESGADKLIEFLKEEEYEDITLDKIINTPYIIVDGLLNNERIKRQQGAFILFGINNSIEEGGNKYAKSVFDLKSICTSKYNDSDFDKRIIIKKEEKPIILDELSAFGIDESFLFPELEYQASRIKNKYK
ncbi:MAG: FRG domain-containing protein [Lachnospiraceae bacterium]|jgi:hypothetical protein|nr:FRG domain-containing protein [Lachnospiraceae bacterium]